MTTIHVDDVLRVLRQEPNGLTTKQVAERLNLSRLETISCRLSRMADYGTIEREHRKHPQRFCIWKAKDVGE